MTLTMPLKRLLILTAGAISLIAQTSQCRAQPGSGLPADVITAPTLNDAQKERIRTFVDQHKAGLSGDALEIRRSRNALLEPLRNESASVTFRLEYAGDLEPALRPLVSSEKPIVAVNAVRIAGELATPKGIDLLEPAIADKRPAVRYEAVVGFAHTFQAAERSNPALAAGQAINALDTLKNGMLKETDWHVIEGYVQALKAGTKVPYSKLKDVRAKSVNTLAEAMGAKAQNANDPPGKAAPEELETMYSAFQRSAQTVRDAVTNQNINEPQLGTAELKAAGALGGDLIANIRRRALAGELKVPDGDPKAEAAAKATRSRFARIAADSERAVFFAASALGAPTGDLNVNLGDKLQQGKDDDFAKDSLRLMGPNGILTGNPFNYPDDRFVK